MMIFDYKGLLILDIKRILLYFEILKHKTKISIDIFIKFKEMMCFC